MASKLRRKSNKTNPVEASVYSAPQLMRLTGITRRQIRYWATIKLLAPRFRNAKARGSQHASFYAAEDVRKALVILELTRRGLSLVQVRRIEKYLRKKERLSLSESARYLITDGNTAYYAESATRVVDILKHENQMLLVPLWEHMTKLEERFQREVA